MDNLKKFDQNGKPLNLMPLADGNVQGNYYKKWIDSGKTRFEPTSDDIKCELQLSAIGDFEPLKFKLDQQLFSKEIEPWKNEWVPYLRREGVSNDRSGLLLVGLDGDSPTDSLSMPEARKRVGHRLDETDFTVKTELYKQLTCLHPLLETFDTLGRTMLIKSNAGGWFPPHRDWPILTRDCFRIIVFIGKHVDHMAYEWEMNGKRWPIQQNRAYYVDTRKTHRTHSWQDDSIHCVVNVPKTWENVMKTISMLAHF